MMPKKPRKHTPITTPKQMRFFGRELGEKRKGDGSRTDMSTAELRRHLLEWGRKRKRKRGKK
jgi:hypothetical protein